MPHAIPMRSKNVSCRIFLAAVCMLWVLAPTVTANHIKVCESQIYCQGPMLQAIQQSHFFSDSKTFVDMATKRNEREVSLAMTSKEEINWHAFSI